MKIDSEVKSQLDAARDSASIALVLEWDDSAALEAAKGKGTRQEKLLAMRQVLAQLKSPLLRELNKMPMVQVNDIEGSSHAVVEATASRWRQLFERNFMKTSDVRLNPNYEFFVD